MPNYGRNFEVLMGVEVENRLARFVTPSSGTWVNGAPVTSDDTAGIDALGRQTVKAASASTPPIKGRDGILLYEHGDGATWAGVDPYLTTYSDLGTAPNSKAVQVISGPNVKVLLRNTDAITFLNTRSYAARNLMPETGATPQFTVGQYFEPHSSPSDSNGYWQVTATKANAWLVVVRIDSTRQEAECQFLF